jgi:carbon monoxide dehydrogenase subunit G
MTRIESSILVSKSVEDTFAFLNDSENHLKFIPNMVEFNKTSTGIFGQVGSTVQGALRILGIRMEVPYEVIEHQQNKSLAMKGLIGPITFKDGYVLNPAGKGTQINFWLELTLTGLAKVFKPFAGLIGKIHAYETLTKLKRTIEKAN